MPQHRNVTALSPTDFSNLEALLVDRSPALGFEDVWIGLNEALDQWEIVTRTDPTTIIYIMDILGANDWVVP